MHLLSTKNGPALLMANLVYSAIKSSSGKEAFNSVLPGPTEEVVSRSV